MRPILVLAFLFAVLVVVATAADEAETSEDVAAGFKGQFRAKSKRRKVRKKVVSSSMSEENSQGQEEHPAVEVIDNRDGRGFLDQYYQQFDQKVEPVLQETESTGRQHTIALAEELGGQQSESLVSQTIASPYIIPVPLPVDGEDTTGAPNKRAFIKGLGSSSSSSSTSYSSPASSAYSFPTGSYESPSTFINSDLPSYSASVPTEYSSVGSGLKQAASKYFGVATTNDQNIQLGLTFTVPFLSIPLNSLTNIFNSGGTSGLSGVSNFFNFDTSNLITIGVIAVAAIFILPQVIYWLTGVNLSAFNWGRSDDPSYLNELADNVDVALRRYDVDVRQCMAYTMCDQLKAKAKTSPDEASITGMLGYGIIKSAAKSDMVKKMLGTKKVSGVMEVAESAYKCEDVYSVHSCPWDSRTSKKIITNLILDSDLDLSTLASLAMQGAKAFS